MQNLINRPLYLEKLKGFLNTDLIKIITGVRRSGKSTLFILFQQYLENEKAVNSEQIININLEDAAYKDIDNWQALHDYVVSKLLPEQQNYVFIDEIQNIPEFERAINSLNLKKNVDLYITGSNARMLSSEIATLISGRYIEVRMLPLSFKEYMSVTRDKTNLPEKFKNFLDCGSFPGAMQFNGDKTRIDDYIKGIYSTIILKDIVARKRIHDVYRLENVISFMFNIIGSQTSINNIYKTMKADGREVQTATIEGYLSALLESFILYKVGRFDIKGKQLLKTNDKYYLVDIGFRNIVLGRRDDDGGHILENMVYLELLRRGYEVYIGKVGNKEIDFIVRKNGIVEYYQVSQSVLDPNTLKREIAPLNSVKDHNPKFLLTMDYTNVNVNGIKQINVLDWLLEGE
ncbi:MAG: ATP-binding protein [Elusimicrobiota bacterium]|jgi:predicted AAA+ superfamily ATPase|nr:ATP-binding protein [Elusimicrobiota bacterium]